MCELFTIWFNVHALAADPNIWEENDLLPLLTILSSIAMTASILDQRGIRHGSEKDLLLSSSSGNDFTFGCLDVSWPSFDVLDVPDAPDDTDSPYFEEMFDFPSLVVFDEPLRYCINKEDTDFDDPVPFAVVFWPLVDCVSVESVDD